MPLKSVEKESKKKNVRDFPGGAVDKNLPANAGDTGSDLWSGKIPRAAEQLSPCATTAEARAPRARAPQQEKPLQGGARAPRGKAAPTRRN